MCLFTMHCSVLDPALGVECITVKHKIPFGMPKILALPTSELWLRKADIFNVIKRGRCTMIACHIFISV